MSHHALLFLNFLNATRIGLWRFAVVANFHVVQRAKRGSLVDVKKRVVAVRQDGRHVVAVMLEPGMVDDADSAVAALVQEFAVAPNLVQKQQPIAAGAMEQVLPTAGAGGRDDHSL